MADSSEKPMSSLMALYLAKRVDFVRFFTARTGSPSEAEDIVQDMFLKLADHDGDPIENPAAYLYRLGSNVMIDRMRSRRRTSVRDDAFYQTGRVGPQGGEDEADLVAPESALDARRRLDRLVARVQDLPPQCRRVFIMHKFEDRSHGEIAQILGVSRSAVEKHMINALRRLSDEKP